jgi:hypothetical protein
MIFLPAPKESGKGGLNAGARILARIFHIIILLHLFFPPISQQGAGIAQSV